MGEQYAFEFDLEPAVFTVSRLTRHIKELLESDTALQDLWVQGEVSNFSRSAAGHIYFTLKDEEASIKCVLWRSAAEWVDHIPQDGQAVILHGRISVYEPQGAYQFYVDLVQPAGVGALFLRFQALKERLAKEGLFAPERKRPLPPFPKTIGVVTSPQAAAWRDILRILGERGPLAEVILAPAQVQGEAAAQEIANALYALNEHTEADVIILARGGGSLEELWPFNEEIVARAIYESRIPVISGVGHETDFTIADFVADVRAPTPTAASSLAVPDQKELHANIERYSQELAEALETQLSQNTSRLADLNRHLLRLSPQQQVTSLRQRVDDLTEKLGARWQEKARRLRTDLEGKWLQLACLDPQATLDRGYSVTTHYQSGHVIKKISQVVRGQKVAVQVSDGKFTAEVEELTVTKRAGKK